MNNKKWSQEELRLIATDSTDKQLAKIMNRSVNAIRKMRYKTFGKMKEGYNKRNDFDSLYWGRQSLGKFSRQLKVGDIVTVFYKVYGYDTTKTQEGKAEVLKKFPAVVRTDKGDYQYKELYKWKQGGNFE